MITSILMGGFIVVLGFLVLLWKLPRRISLWLLGRGFTLDVVISALAYILHAGSFTGLMIAATAGLMCSGATSLARMLFGCIRHGRIEPGHLWEYRP